MSYTIEQKVKNHVYLYQVESYWDKEKKQSRQKRTYLGKKDPKTGELVQEEPAYGSWDFGHTAFLQALSKKLGVTAELKSAFPSLWIEVLTLAFYKLAEGKPLYLCSHWLETVDLEEKPKLSSQRISALLHELSRQKDAIFRFFTAWAARNKEANRFIVFDITSFSSYGKSIDYLEWGYNRDKETMPQVNLGVVYGRPLDLPIFYSLYPGSIHDVSTLTNILTELNILSLEATTFVLDKGFYSASNLSKMKEIGHVIPLPLRTKGERALVEKHQGSIRSSEYAVPRNTHVLYCVAEKLSLGNVEYRAYVYLDEKRGADEKEAFLKSIMECERYIEKEGYRGKAQLTDFFTERKPALLPYFGLHKNGSRYELQRDTEAIDATLARMGMFVLITNTDLSGEQSLQLYREKDGVEKCFDSLKNNLSLKRLCIHSQEALEGLLFIEFISLILYSAISKGMRESGLNTSLTIPEVLFELRKIKKIRFGRKKTMISEISKGQRKILGAFDISVG
ncbi:MAG: transposase [Spirochaetota bacterium]|nr:transposase [Spirochaetota bacterium]